MKSVWSITKTALAKISRVQAALLMGLVYYLIIGPVAILYQLLQRNKEERKSYWVKKEKIEDMEVYLKRQF